MASEVPTNATISDSSSSSSSSKDTNKRNFPQQEESRRRLRYGPFHRLQSPTQSIETARLQQASSEVWGKPRRYSDIPQVQAYTGSLAPNTKGIEFYTDTQPDKGTPPGQVRWTGPRDGVRVETTTTTTSVGNAVGVGEDDVAKIKVQITQQND